MLPRGYSASNNHLNTVDKHVNTNLPNFYEKITGMCMQHLRQNSEVSVTIRWTPSQNGHYSVIHAVPRNGNVLNSDCSDLKHIGLSYICSSSVWCQIDILCAGLLQETSIHVSNIQSFSTLKWREWLKIFIMWWQKELFNLRSQGCWCLMT